MHNTVNCFPQNVIYGEKALEGASKQLEGHKLFLLSDNGIKDCGILEKAKEILNPAFVSLLNCREPRISDAQAVLEAFISSGADAMCGLGGGSVMDVAKAVAAAAGSGKKIAELIGNNTLLRSARLVLIPTTAGTGSEATCNAIFIDDADGVKKAMISAAMIPDIAVLDPELSIGLPPAITAFTGVDALCHCAESYISVNANELSRAWSLRGIQLILENLPKAIANPTNLEARQNMLFASLFGGAALRIAGTTAVHALAYPLGKRGVPHGVANSLLFMSVMKNTIPDIEKMLPNFYELCAMIKTLPLPSISRYSVSAAETAVLASEAMEQTRLLNNHPVKVSYETAKRIYEELF